MMQSKWAGAGVGVGELELELGGLANSTGKATTREDLHIMNNDKGQVGRMLSLNSSNRLALPVLPDALNYHDWCCT
jgi:hypothetical protein